MDRIASSRGKTETLCLVCGDKASGRHYGVPSCDGCRGFFKRSIRRNLDYLCKESNQCVVDVSRRNQCQACRFRRCLEVNMKRDAVQHERAPRGALKRSYAAEFIPPITAATPLLPAHPLPHSSTINGNQQSSVYCAAIPFSWRPTITMAHQSTSAIPRQYPINIIAPSSTSTIDSSASSAAVNLVKEDEVSSSANEDAVQNRRREDGQTPLLSKATAKIDTTKPLLELGFPRSGSDDRDDSNDINEAAARLLLFAVRWAKTIPSFCQLSFRDQNLLLEDSWCELFILTIAQWGLNLDEVQLSRACLEIPSDRQEYLREVLQQMRQLVLRIQRCRLDHTEFACLKALVLFKPEARGLRDELAVEILQDQTQIMLHEYCSPPATNLAARPNGLPVFPPHPMLAGRFGKILLLIPTLRAIPVPGVIDIFFRKLIGDLSIARLLMDFMSAAL